MKQRAVRLPKWSSAALIARSPIVKSVSAIPVFGYLILWSDEYLFTLRTLKSAAALNPVDSVYLTYWGALIMTVGIAIYLLWCPHQIKKHRCWQDYADETRRVSGSNEIAQGLLAAFSVRNSWETSTVNGTELDHLFVRLMRIGETLFDRELSSDFRVGAPVTRDVIQHMISGVYDGDKTLFRRERQIDLAKEIATHPKIFSAEVAASVSTILQEYFYILQNRRPVRSMLAALFLYGGGVILLTPTVDTLMRVTCITFPATGSVCSNAQAARKWIDTHVLSAPGGS